MAKNPIEEYLKETGKSNPETHPVYDETDRPIVEYLNNEENQDKIIFSHLLKSEERVDADFISVVQEAIDSLKKLYEKGTVDNLRVHMESSLITLYDDTKWMLNFDNCSAGSICIADKENSSFKMQIPINKITAIIISKE